MNDEEAIAAGLMAVANRLRVKGISFAQQSDVLAHACMRLHWERREILLGYWFTKEMQLIAIDELATGSAKSVEFDLSELLRTAITRRAEMAVIVHNHPSGNPTPSDSDRGSAKDIDCGLAAVGILAVGHFVIADLTAVSVRTGERFNLKFTQEETEIDKHAGHLSPANEEGTLKC